MRTLRCAQAAILAGVSAASFGCGPDLDPREAEIATVFAEADAPLIRSRPTLVAGKYRRMSEDPFSFYRGSVPLFEHDFEAGAYDLADSDFALEAPGPLSLADAHPENFGTLRGGDGVCALEPNDFD